jgi:hypothetical protein
MTKFLQQVVTQLGTEHKNCRINTTKTPEQAYDSILPFYPTMVPARNGGGLLRYGKTDNFGEFMFLYDISTELPFRCNAQIRKFFEIGRPG